mmetsp:Transcript_17140/g.34745  ORF Transcript_17140/g.34745 Transcript_17140/m.34745 type:complete len:218 (-) Transcript_17140:357-1010(-)
MQASRFWLSSSFSCNSSSTSLSMASFTLVIGSNFTVAARADNLGSSSLAPTERSISTAWVRRASPPRLLRAVLWKNAAGFMTLLKVSRAASSLNMVMASEMACASVWRIATRSEYWCSVWAQRSFRSRRKAPSAESALRRSSISSFAWAFLSSLSALRVLFWSMASWVALISASFAAFSSSYAWRFHVSSFCVSARLLSKVSFICLRIPKISPDWDE